MSACKACGEPTSRSRKHPGWNAYCSDACRYPTVPVGALLEVASPLDLARLEVVDRRTIRRWIVAGEVPVWSADEIACAMGRHPAELWPEWGT